MWRLILRHAWLNLWDKHMTTGRINQVLSEENSNDTAEALPSRFQLQMWNRVSTLVSKLMPNPKSRHELKSGFARATWITTHTLTSRPTKNAQSYWVMLQRCATSLTLAVLECYAESFYTPSVLIQIPRKLPEESTEWRIRRIGEPLRSKPLFV